LTINKKNFRSTLVALAFGALVTVLPASADTISTSVSTTPSDILVGGYSFMVSTAFGTANSLTGTFDNATPVNLHGGTLANELLLFTSNGATAPNSSEVVDVTFVNPTVSLNGGTAAAQTSVTFQGTVAESGTGQYSLTFGTGTFGSGASAVTQFDNGAYTVINSGGVAYEIQSATTLNVGPAKQTYINGLIGVAIAPEPATFATTGLAAAFLGLFLRRKVKQNS
jgi:hypothetical protein